MSGPAEFPPPSPDAGRQQSRHPSPPPRSQFAPPSSLPPPGPPPQRSYKGRIFLVIVAVIVVIGVLGKDAVKKKDDDSSSSSGAAGVALDDAGGGTHTVRYTVSGTAANGDITYETPTGTGQDAAVALPTSRTFEMSSGDFVYMSIQNDTDVGKVSCSIEVDGVVISKNSSTGAYTIASCDGSVP